MPVASTIHPTARILQAAKLSVSPSRPVGVKYHSEDEHNWLLRALMSVPPEVRNRVTLVYVKPPEEK